MKDNINKFVEKVSSRKFAHIITIIGIIYFIFFMFLGDMVNRSVSMVGTDYMPLFFVWICLAIISLSSNMFLFYNDHSYNNKLARVFVYISIVCGIMVFAFPTSETNMLQETIHVYSAISFTFFFLAAFFMGLVPQLRRHRSYVYIFSSIIIVIIGSLVYGILFAPIFNGFAETIPLISSLLCLTYINYNYPRKFKDNK